MDEHCYSEWCHLADIGFHPLEMESGGGKTWIQNIGVFGKQNNVTTQCKRILDGGIDNEWDTYVSSLESAGLQIYLDIYLSIYDRYMTNYNKAIKP